jgi:CMP/dCMP kinase
MTTSIPVITIDGPSGTGKGTVAQRLAQQLGWHYLDSGAMYRALALAVKRHDIASDDIEALVLLAKHLDLRFEVGQLPARVIVVLEGEVVSDEIRREEIGLLASKVSAFQEVRTAMLARQHAFREAPGLVTDGRDMGTVVFSEAALKFYLTASAEERAKRRHLQLKAQGKSVKLAALLEDLVERDRRDTARSASPLKPAEDAIEIDTSEMDVDEVMSRVIKKVESLNLV